jgi:hypothetical protein
MRTTLLAAAAVALLAVSSNHVQAQEDGIIVCVCKTTTRTEPIMFLGYQIGTRTITETQCWYE